MVNNSEFGDTTSCQVLKGRTSKATGTHHKDTPTTFTDPNLTRNTEFGQEKVPAVSADFLQCESTVGQDVGIFLSTKFELSFDHFLSVFQFD